MSAAAIAYHHAVQALVCDAQVPWQYGVAVFARAFPTYFAYNSVRVQGSAPGLSAEALIAVTDRLQEGLTHRNVEVEEPGLGERLRPGFEAGGWRAERLVWMELEGPAHGGGAAPVAIEQVPFPATRTLRRAWFETAPWAESPEAITQFLTVEEAVAQRRGTRAVLARAAGGEEIGFAAFSLLGGAAEVELVDVAEEHRNRGVGGALVRAAVAAAGAPRTWIVADDERDAKRLYARLGFVPAWIQHVFTRSPQDG